MTDVALAQGDDDWWKKVFTQTEYDEMIRSFEDAENEHEDGIQNPPFFSAFADVLQSDATQVLNFLRATAQDNQSVSVRQFCVSIGHSICMNYMADTDVEYVEELTDHAIWFGVVDDLFEDDDDVEDEEDDDDE